MTKHNILVLWGLVAALSLQAGEASRLQGPALTEALGQVRLGKNPFASAASSISEVAPQGLRNYVLNKGSDALSSTRNALGSGGSYLWNKGGNVLGSAGNVLSSARSSAGNVLSSAGGYASRAWDWSKGVPGAGVVPRGLGQLGSMGYDYGQRAASAGWQGLKAAPSATWEGLKSAPGAIAGYATNPYIAQNIAQRLPSASFVKDYPGITNVAAALAAAGAGYTLYKGGQYAADSYYGPLDSQILALMRQENDKDIPKEALANIHNKLDPLLAQKAEQLLASAPNTDVYTKIDWLLNFMTRNKNSYPSKFVFSRLLYYISNIAIDLLKKHQQTLLAHIDREQKDLQQGRIAPKYMDKAMQMLEPFYNEVTDINNLINDLRNRSNRLPKPEEQAPGYFSGWWKRSAK